MDRHTIVYVSKYDFKVGDMVIVAKDFDNNVKTKKFKLSSFFARGSRNYRITVKK